LEPIVPVINIEVLQDVLGGTTPVSASITATVNRASVDAYRVSTKFIIFPRDLVIPIVNGVPTTPFILTSLAAGYYWHIDVFVNGEAPVRRTVIVPEGAGPFNFEDLIDVVPETALPDTSQDIYQAWLSQILTAMQNTVVSAVVVDGDLILTQGDGDTVNAGNVVGPSGIVTTNAPLTNTGTSTSAVLGINQSALTISPSQVTGTAVVTADSRLSDNRTPTEHATAHGAAGSDPVTISQTQVTNLTTSLSTKADLVGGFVPQSQIPAVAITDTFVVASQAAMLALTAETGDVAVRSDLSKSFILKGTSSSTLADWQELLTPASGVSSITAVSPLTGGTITSNGSIGIDQAALVIAPSQVTGTAIIAGDTRLLPSGGATGQVLSKTSYTNYAAAWAPPAAPVLARKEVSASGIIYLSVANTFYPTATNSVYTLTAGTWLITGSVLVETPANTAAFITIRVGNASNGYAGGTEVSVPAMGSGIKGYATIPVSTVWSTSGELIRVEVASTVTGCAVLPTPVHNSSGYLDGTASMWFAVKIS
jgi:hypothetical protein